MMMMMITDYHYHYKPNNCCYVVRFQLITSMNDCLEAVLKLLSS